jgi:hypothetical protein
MNYFRSISRLANRYFGLLLFLPACLLHTATSRYIIVFDITSTLEVNQKTIRTEVPGFVGGVTYALSTWTTKPSAAIEQDFRNLLASFGKQQAPADLLIRDPEGRPVSEILIQWLIGAQSAAQIVQQIKLYAEYDIFNSIAKTVFNERIIAKHTHVVPSMTQCVEQCAQLLPAERLYLIGNWDPNSFAILSTMSATQAVFSKIPSPNRCISGITRLLLPRNADVIFTRIAESAQVPRDCIIFVSTMPYHIAAAQRAGVHGVALLPHNIGLTLQTIIGLLQS